MQVALDGKDFVLRASKPADMMLLRAALPSARYEGEAWRLPQRYASVWWLGRLARRLEEGGGLDWTPEAAERAKELDAEGARLRLLSQVGSRGLPTPLLAGLAATLDPHQAAGLAFLADSLGARSGVMIHDAIGSGKTVEALALLESKSLYPALVVARASLLPHWQDHARRFLPGRTCGRVDAKRHADAEVMVASLDGLRTVLGSWLCQPVRGLKAVVLDEADDLRNGCRTARGRAFGEVLAAHPGAKRVLMTATPVINGAADLLPQVDAVGALALFGGRAAFRALAATRSGAEGVGAILSGEGYVLSRTREQMGLSLPSFRRSIEPLEVQGAQARGYAEAVRQAREWRASVDMEQAWTTAVRAAAGAHVEALRQAAALAKMPAIVEQVTTWVGGGESVLLFTHHHATSDALVAALKAQDAMGGPPVSVVLLDGREPPEARVRALEAFQRKEARVAVAGLKVGGSGLDGFQRATRLIGFVELGWHLAGMEQAEGRAWRRGQERGVLSTWWVSTGTIEEKQLGIIHRKGGEAWAVEEGGRLGDATLRWLLSEI